MKGLINRLFNRCKHEWEVYEICVVHYPDYEPHKIGIIYHCKNCGKEKRRLMIPKDFIEKYGLEKYNRVLEGEFEHECC